MISVGAANAALIKRGSKAYRYAVSYKRRYWDYNTAAYVWESAWTELPRAEVKQIPAVTMALDLTGVTDFKSSNVTITVANPLNKWADDNPDGLFAKTDATARYGYKLKFSQVKIELFYVTEAGAEQSAVPVFYGYVTDWVGAADDRTMQLQLESTRGYLAYKWAEYAATTVTGESLGTANGTTLDFYTSKTGVGFVDQVTDNGVVQTLGVDYQVSQTNDPANPVKVSFVSAPLNGHAIACSYRYWPGAGTLVQNESVGTGNGTNKVFTTANNRVGAVTAVSVNGVAQSAGSQYNVSALNIDGTPATITFVTAPPNGDSVVASYTYGQSPQTIDALVNDLLTLAGVGTGSSSRQVDGVVFPNGVTATKYWATSADWLTGSLSNIDTSSSTGKILKEWFKVDDFADGDYSSNPSWTASGTGSASIVSGMLRCLETTGSGGLEKISTGISGPYVPYGTWQFDVNWDNSTAGNGSGTPPPDTVGRVIFVQQGGSFLNQPIQYMLEFRVVNNSTTKSLYLVKQNTDGSHTALTGNLYPSGVPSGTTTFRVTRSAAGLITVYAWGGSSWASLGSATDTQMSIAGSFILTCTANISGAAADLRIGNIWWSQEVDATSSASTPTTANGVWTSATVDTGSAGPTVWGTAIATYPTLPSDVSVLIETNVSADGTTWDGWLAVAANGAILSALKRYLQLRVTITTSTLNATVDNADVASLTVTYSTSSAPISLANYTNYTVDQAILELAKLCSYEYFSDVTGKVYFRQRPSSTVAVYDVEQQEFAGMPARVPGHDRVVNLVRASFGGYVAEVSPKTQNDPSPNSADDNGVLPLNLSNTQLMLDADYNVAYGAALFYYSLFSTPRARFRFTTHLLPQLELDDVVNCWLADAVPAKPWVIGDTSVRIGDQTLQLYGERQQALYGRTLRIIYSSHDVAAERSTWEAEAVD